MDKGHLVSDDIMIAMIEKRTGAPDCQKGFILDGFPRTVPQAEALDAMLARRRLKLDYVIELAVDEAALVDRISGRFSCAKCGASYHDRNKRPKVEGVCDVCGSKDFIRRADDNAEALKKRLEAYRTQTAPLVDHYASTGLLHTVDGMAPIEDVTGAITRALAERAFRPQPAAARARKAPVQGSAAKPKASAAAPRATARKVSCVRSSAAASSQPRKRKYRQMPSRWALAAPARSSAKCV